MTTEEFMLAIALALVTYGLGFWGGYTFRRK
jgi:hypothetical protein